MIATLLSAATPGESPAGMPTDDWQFWAVTVLVIGTVGIVAFRGIRASREKNKTRVSLTVERDRPQDREP